MRGGARKGSGRKKGGGDARLELVRQVLEAHRAELIGTAIRLATGRKPCVPVLTKLIDKVLPSLHSATVAAEVSERLPFGCKTHGELHGFALEMATALLRREEERQETPKALPSAPASDPRPDRQP